MKISLINLLRLLFYFLFSIFFTAVVHSAQGQNKFYIYGKISTSSQSNSLSKASVSIFQKNNLAKEKIIAFTFSDAEGNYSLNVNLVPGEYILKVSYIGYSVLEKLLHLSPEINQYHINFLMQTNDSHLDSIFIKDEAPFRIKKDTIEYKADSFRNNETRKIGDLLSNIDGFKIQADGKINYRGKEVKSLLINGDDLASDDYGLLTQNLNSTFIDKIQVIENYNKNRLRGDVIKSDEIAVNLKTNEKLKSVFNGSVAAGASIDGKFEGDINTIWISNKLKYVQLINANNTGKNKSETIHLNSDNSVQSILNAPSLIQSSVISTPNLPLSYLKKNNDYLMAPFLFYSFSNKYKIALRLKEFSSSEQLEDNNFISTTIDFQNSWTLGNTNKLRKKNNALGGSFEFIHDNQNKFAGNAIFNFSIPTQKNLFQNITNGAINDSVSENLYFRKTNFSVNYSGTSKVGNQSILDFSTFIYYQPELNNFEIATSRFSDYFKQSNSAYTYWQNTEIETYGNKSTFAFITKRRNTSMRLGISNDIKFQSFTNLLSSEKINSQKTDTLVFNRNKKPHSERYLTDFTLIKPLNNKLELQIQSYVGLQSLSTIDSKKEFLTWRIAGLLSWKIKAFSQTSFSAAKIQFLPPLNYFLYDSLINGNSVLQTKSTTIVPIKYTEFTFTTSFFNLRKNASFNTNVWYKNYETNYRPDFFLSPGFSILNYVPVKNDHEWGFLLSAKTYIFRLHSSVSFTSFVSSNTNHSIINKNNAINKSTNWNATILLVTSLSFPLNAEIGGEFFLGANEQTTINGSFKNQNKFYSLHTKLRWVINHQLFFGAQYQFLKDDSGSKFQIADIFSTYSFPKKISVDLKVHNLFNQTSFKRESITPNTVGVYNYFTVGRYVLAVINFSF